MAPPWPCTTSYEGSWGGGLAARAWGNRRGGGLQPLRESQAEAGGRHAHRALWELDWTSPCATSRQPPAASRANRLGKIELDSLLGPHQVPTSDLSLPTPFAKFSPKDFPPTLSPVTDTSKHYSPYFQAQAGR